MNNLLEADLKLQGQNISLMSIKFRLKNKILKIYVNIIENDHKVANNNYTIWPVNIRCLD